jgi:hypothetical protein
MDSHYLPTYRSDGQLEAILFETAVWTVNGRNGQILCTVSSLRQALDDCGSCARTARPRPQSVKFTSPAGALERSSPICSAPCRKQSLGYAWANTQSL